MILTSLFFLKVEKVAFPSHSGLIYLISASELYTTPERLAVTVFNLKDENNAGLQYSNCFLILSK